jgi:hypothetical protein
MKLTDLLRKSLSDFAKSEAIYDMYELIPDIEGVPDSIDDFSTDDHWSLLLDSFDQNFKNFEYENLYSLVEFIRDLNNDSFKTIDEDEQLEDIEKEILYTTFIIQDEETDKFYKAEFHTGYYNFPQSNDMKEVKRKTKTITYFE